MDAKTQFTYLFDPLCGWCYAAAPTIKHLSETPGVRLTMMPMGLFAAPRPVSTIADHARAHDDRIQELTGQPFTDAYHTGVMRAAGGVLSSLALTRALVALDRIDPAFGPRFLNTAQTARYVEGQDTSRPEVVARIGARIADGALDEASLLSALQDDPALATATDQRIAEGQRIMQELGILGVPQLVVSDDRGTHLIGNQLLYSGGDVVLATLNETA